MIQFLLVLVNIYKYINYIYIKIFIIHVNSIENNTPPNAVPKVEVTPAAHAQAKISNLFESLCRICLNIGNFITMSAIAELICIIGPSRPTDKPTVRLYCNKLELY